MCSECNQSSAADHEAVQTSAGWSTWMARGFGSLPDEFRDELDAIYALHAAKRSDYTADSEDRLANYRFASEMMGVSIERGMLGRASEKLFRLKSIFEKDGNVKVSDETVQDTLRDIAIICVLLKLELDRKALLRPMK